MEMGHMRTMTAAWPSLGKHPEQAVIPVNMTRIDPLC